MRERERESKRYTDARAICYQAIHVLGYVQMHSNKHTLQANTTCTHYKQTLHVHTTCIQMCTQKTTTRHSIEKYTYMYIKYLDQVTQSVRFK